MEKRITFDLGKVSPNKRFLNFIIDFFVIFLLYLLLTLLLVAFFDISDPMTFQYTAWFTFIISFVSYYTIMEYRFGRTIGKFVTNTRVVRANGQKPLLGDIAVRTLLRLVPFEGLTFLFPGNGFHDSKSKTKLVINV